MKTNNVTGLICVYNGQKALQRALDSLSGEVDRIILVDDGSTDGTADIAQSFDQIPLHYLRHHRNLGLGAARQTALQHCNTRFAVWLDADDELLPGRVVHALPLLENGADFVFDASELYLSENHIQQRFVPNFIRTSTGLCWQFARNYIPALAVPVFRVAKAKQTEYQPMRNAEDYLFMLQSLLAGAKFGFSDFIGYREYPSEQSLSRQTANQHQGRAESLQQLGLDRVKDFLNKQSVPFSELYLILAIYCTQSYQWSALEQCINTPLVEDVDRLSWYRAFFSGIAHFKQNRFTQALAAFKQASAINPSQPEAWNNLGVCQHYKEQDASQHFQQALTLRADYADASHNMTSAEKRLTLIPLRNHTTEQPFC